MRKIGSDFRFRSPEEAQVVSSSSRCAFGVLNGRSTRQDSFWEDFEPTFDGSWANAPPSPARRGRNVASVGYLAANLSKGPPDHLGLQSVAEGQNLKEFVIRPTRGASVPEYKLPHPEARRFTSGAKRSLVSGTSHLKRASLSRLCESWKGELADALAQEVPIIVQSGPSAFARRRRAIRRMSRRSQPPSLAKADSHSGHLSRRASA